jgi:Zn-dependent protease
MTSFVELLEIRYVKVYVHWSVIAISGLFLIGALERPWELLVALFSYYGVILLHECGHMVAAQRKGYRVHWIKLYPILGLVSFEQPYSRYDHAVIAWAGIVAQSLVGIPIVLWLSIFGYSKFDALNVGLGIWGYMSLTFAVFNLILVPPLDGAIAWKLVPEVFRKLLNRSKRQKDNHRNPYRFRDY